MVKKVVTIIGIIFVILFIVGCIVNRMSPLHVLLAYVDMAITKVVAPRNTILDEQVRMTPTKEACAALGGVWTQKPEPPILINVCAIPAQDAGKNCFSGFQCKSGTCLAQDQKTLSPEATCSDGVNDEGKCIRVVHFGIVFPEGCTVIGNPNIY